MNGLTIGQIAKQARVHVETLRYYERRGLVARPPRSGSNYRLYPHEAVTRLQFINRAQDLGFSLKEIKKLLQATCKSCGRLLLTKQQAQEFLAELEQGEESGEVLEGFVPRETAREASKKQRCPHCGIT